MYAPMKDFLHIKMGPPLHSFIIPSPNPHFMETDVLDLFAYKPEENEEEDDD